MRVTQKSQNSLKSSSLSLRVVSLQVNQRPWHKSMVQYTQYKILILYHSDAASHSLACNNEQSGVERCKTAPPKWMDDLLSRKSSIPCADIVCRIRNPKELSARLCSSSQESCSLAAASSWSLIFWASFLPASLAFSLLFPLRIASL